MGGRPLNCEKVLQVDSREVLFVRALVLRAARRVSGVFVMCLVPLQLPRLL